MRVRQLSCLSVCLSAFVNVVLVIELGARRPLTMHESRTSTRRLAVPTDNSRHVLNGRLSD